PADSPFGLWRISKIDEPPRLRHWPWSRACRAARRRGAADAEGIPDRRAVPRVAAPGPLEALRQRLRDLGYEEGRNVTIEWRFAGARTERLRDLAEELVRLKVDVIVAINTSASLAAKQATVTMPIVIARVSDPVRTGLVASFARPGG